MWEGANWFAVGPYPDVRPAWAHSRRCKSSRELVTVSEVKRNCRRATNCGKKAGLIFRADVQETERARAMTEMRCYLGDLVLRLNGKADVFGGTRNHSTAVLLEVALTRANMVTTWIHVKADKASADSDWLTIGDIQEYL